MSEIKDKVERVSPEELIPYQNNPKEHPESQIDKIASSIKNYGFVQPIVVDEENEIIIGHGRLQAAKKLEKDEVPIIRADHLSEAEIKALRIADNKVAESGWDDELLGTELEQLKEIEGFDEELSGFSQDDIDQKIKENNLNFGPAGPEDQSQLDEKQKELEEVECPDCGTEFVPE